MKKRAGLVGIFKPDSDNVRPLNYDIAVIRPSRFIVNMEVYNLA